MLHNLLITTVLTAVLSAPTVRADATSISAFQYADTFNRDCSGAVIAFAEEAFGEENLPDPLQIEALLKQGILQTLGDDGSGSVSPSYSRLQTDLEILNVSQSMSCQSFRWVLEQEFHIYGMKAWVERAGASSYLLIHRTAEVPHIIHLKTYYTW